ncbi:hypothetical protein [Streptomyces sp. ISL-43]|uniref:hypothetical protein n=1 Tax=Streptomyces sp. ISL-43 TaxID=2819183 RepID=UPI00203597E5|nr:hypothetical protein [Streptomyces sp. ISL-43]
MTSRPCAQEYEKAYNELLGAAARLHMLRRLEGVGLDSHATAAMHAIGFAATILWLNVPGPRRPATGTTASPSPSWPPNRREAALELGDYAPERPTMRLFTDTTPPS